MELKPLRSDYRKNEGYYIIIIPGHLEILTTNEWGARTPVRALEKRAERFKGGIFHHTAGANHAQSPMQASQKRNAIALAQSIQSSHIDVNKWSDSGHSFLNSVDGVICEGRTGTLKALMSGTLIVQAHCADDTHWFNDWIGVENEGTFITAHMNDTQMLSLIKLLAWTSIVADYDTSVIQGHRAALPGATCCPGDWLFAQTANIRKAVHDKKLEFIKLGVKKS